MAEPAGDPRAGNEARYDRLARYYTPLLQVASLGQVARLYRAVAAELEVPVGGTLVELGCGPASVTPHLRAALAPQTRILGIDLSADMIAQARARAQRAGWHNVDFERANALVWQPAQPVDAVVLSLALTTFPEPLRCVDRALAWLAPRGQLVVLDSFLIPGRRLANWIVRAKASAVGALPEALPFAALLERLEAPRVRALFGGSYTLVSGRRARPHSETAGAADSYL